MKPNTFACLMYHFVQENGGQYSVTRSQLHEQLSYLQQQGFVVEDFEQLEQRIRACDPLPGRYALMTIDDGESSCSLIADALSRYGFRATFFVIRDFARKANGYLSEQEIVELRRAGFSIGTHGTSHRGLSRMPLATARQELKESREWLEQLLGEQVRYMSAPHGYVNRNVIASIFQAGYGLAGTSTEAVNVLDGLSLPAQIARVAVRRNFTLETLEKIVSGHKPFYSYRRIRSAAFAIPKRLFA
jgi:peptidoglycan/xylan/chitin deacetylase (PgdA/CDA1 family)